MRDAGGSVDAPFTTGPPEDIGLRVRTGLFIPEKGVDYVAQLCRERETERVCELP